MARVSSSSLVRMDSMSDPLWASAEAEKTVSTKPARNY